MNEATMLFEQPVQTAIKNDIRNTSLLNKEI